MCYALSNTLRHILRHAQPVDSLPPKTSCRRLHVNMCLSSRCPRIDRMCVDACKGACTRVYTMMRTGRAEQQRLCLPVVVAPMQFAETRHKNTTHQSRTARHTSELSVPCMYGIHVWHTCMPYMYALHVCFTCMACVYGLCVWLVCMACVYGLCVCGIGPTSESPCVCAAHSHQGEVE